MICAIFRGVLFNPSIPVLLNFLVQESTSSNSAALDLLSMARDRLNKVRGTLCLGIFGENGNLFNVC